MFSTQRLDSDKPRAPVAAVRELEAHNPYTSMPDLSISIVTSEVRLILPCLRSIYDTTRNITFEIYVVINCPESVQAIESAIRSRFPGTRVILNQDVQGFSRSNNRALQLCTGRYLLLLNDDTVVLGRAFQQMVEYMDDQPHVGALGCKLLNPDGSLQWSCGKSAVHKFEYFRSGVLRTLLSPIVRDQLFDSTQEVSWVTGACMMVRAEAAKTVGLLDEQFYMYYEDGDWCCRIVRAGWKVFYYSEAEVIHYRNQTNRKGAAKMVLTYYRSRLQFFGKHFGLGICLVVRALTVCDAIVSYIKALRRTPAKNKVEILRAYLGAIGLALTYRAGRKQTMLRPAAEPK